MTKALLFDLWGTLVETGVKSPTKQVQEILHIGMPFSLFVLRLERTMMTRSFPTLKDAFVAVCKEFHVTPREDIIEELVGMWNKSWVLAQPYEDVMEMLALLQKKYRLVLVSNTDCFSALSVLHKFKLEQYFEKIYFSYELGILKTEEGFLEHVMEELGVDMQDCVFVGDSIQSDMKAAERVGMKHVLMDRKKVREYSPKAASLQELEQYL